MLGGWLKRVGCNESCLVPKDAETEDVEPSATPNLRKTHSVVQMRGKE